MTINIYEGIMPGDPVEVYGDHGLSIEDFIRSQTPNYRRNEVQNVSCSLNGAIVNPLDWCDAIIGESDILDIRPVPRGDALSFVFPFWGGSVAAAQAVINALTPDFDTPGPGQQGQQLETAAARANQPRLGQKIPELLGKYIRYPDYIVPPHRYFVNTTTQAISVLLCVGKGQFSIDTDSIRIGSTSLDDIDQVIDYEIFDPGDDVSGDVAHENWFKAPEVGLTDSSAGIRLRGVTYDERTYFGTGTLGGDMITGILVDDFWSTSVQGSIKITQSVTVTDGGGAVADTFDGAFQHLLAGMTVTVESNRNVSGTYVVTTINGSKTQITLETTGGAPITDATPGSGTMAIDKAGTKYQITDLFGGFSIDVKRILSGGGTDPDWSVLPTVTADLEIIWEANTFTTNSSGPFLACPPGETTDKIEVDIFAPQGLGVIDGESINSRSRTVRIQYRDVDAVSWTTVDQVISGDTRDQLGWTFTINIGSQITPEVRVRRLGEEDTATTSLDRIEWLSLKSQLETPTSYADVTTVAITIEGSEKLANQSESRINLEATRILPVVSGGAIGAPAATRGISDAAVYVAQSLGYDASQLDLDEFSRLQTDVWGPRGDTFNYVFNDTTGGEAISTILRAGFADKTIDGGVIVPVRDEVRAQLEQGYSPENMVGPLIRQFQSRQVDEPDGVEVEYIDGETWTEEVVRAGLPGDNFFKVDAIKLDGVTDRTKAWRIGMRRRRAQRYRRWTYEFGTELDALNSSYLSYVPLLDDISGYGKVCILEDIQADRIVVSEPVEFEAGKTHVVAYRDEEGNAVGPYTATEGPDEYTILVTIPMPWPAVLPSTQEPTHVYFGTTDRWHFPALITEIRPGGPLEVSVSATNYDERVYDDDDSSPP